MSNPNCQSTVLIGTKSKKNIQQQHQQKKKKHQPQAEQITNRLVLELIDEQHIHTHTYT